MVIVIIKMMKNDFIINRGPQNFALHLNLCPIKVIFVYKQENAVNNYE